MAHPNHVNVVPIGERWRVERGTQPIGTYDSQQEAVSAAKREAEQTHAQLVVYGRDGQIHQKTSF